MISNYAKVVNPGNDKTKKQLRPKPYQIKYKELDYYKNFGSNKDLDLSFKNHYRTIIITNNLIIEECFTTKHINKDKI